jgi:hypothetical protein
MLCHCSRPAHIWYVSRPFLILLLIQSKLKQAGQQIGVEGLPMPCVSPELGAAETFDEGGSGGIYRGVGRCRIIQLPTRGSIGAPTQLRSPAAPVAGGRPVAPGAMDVRSSGE